MWRLTRRIGLAALALLLGLIVATAAYVGYAAVRHSRTVALPAPTGGYQVGRSTYEWTDTHRADPYAPGPRTDRKLAVWVWYPAPRDASGAAAAYSPGLWSKLHFPGPVGLGQTSFGAIRSRALVDPPVADGTFPVVVLMPGMGFSVPLYSSLATQLASHGYIVAGVTPTYSANTTVLDGRVIESTKTADPDDLGDSTPHANAAGDKIVTVWASDALFAAATVQDTDRFAGHTTAAVGYAGHSFGGAAALEACRRDPRCGGAADLDGSQFGDVVRTGLRTPLLLLGSEDSCTTGDCGRAATENQSDRDRARSLRRASSGPAYCATIDGARHFNFTDYGAMYLALPLRKLLALGGIDGTYALTVVNTYVTAFFDSAIHHQPQPMLGGDGRYPEVRRGCG